MVPVVILAVRVVVCVSEVAVLIAIGCAVERRLLHPRCRLS